jgi:hypothetical protein
MESCDVYSSCTTVQQRRSGLWRSPCKHGRGTAVCLAPRLRTLQQKRAPARSCMALRTQLTMSDCRRPRCLHGPYLEARKACLRAAAAKMSPVAIHPKFEDQGPAHTQLVISPSRRKVMSCAWHSSLHTPEASASSRTRSESARRSQGGQSIYLRHTVAHRDVCINVVRLDSPAAVHAPSLVPLALEKEDVETV